MKRNELPSFIQIIEAPLRDLTELRLCVDLSAELRSYLDVLIHYLAGEERELEQILENLNGDIYHISLCRLQNLKNVQDDSKLKLLKEIALNESSLSGEAAFVLGMSYLRFKRNAEAVEVFKLAHKRLTELGAMKKAAKSLLNVVVAESRVNPDRRLMRDYEVVALKAEAAGDFITQGICYQNISKEFLDIGAPDLALKYSRKAIELQSADVGQLHYFESILHRCHILITLGKYKEAYLDFQLAKSSPHPQTKEALKCVEKILGADTQPEMQQLEPAWFDKLRQSQSELPKLTKHEMSFLDLVKSGTTSKDEIIRELYGEQINWESSNNRFKVFLSRFRKKYPHLLSEEEGGYRLVDESLLENIGTEP